jgi:hypothetical protein
LSAGLKSILCFVFVFALPAGGACGDTTHEIEHLLKFVESSGCIFIRNGSEHHPAEARKHLARKYAYAKKRINNGEDFIEFLANKSSMTGRPYHVNCQGKLRLSRDWLYEELSAFRAR